uniref:Uncharacterized protein n=1 Tax=Anguilla anguilla TaxID=7936 RepID=A0A0E9XT21_ANGAN
MFTERSIYLKVSPVYLSKTLKGKLLLFKLTI